MLSSHSRWNGVLAYDLRSEYVVFECRPPAYMRREDVFPRAITDADETAIAAWLTRQTEAEFAESKVHRAVQLVALEHAFDPVERYLSRLRWDGTSRIDTWLIDRLGVAPSVYATMVGAKFMIAAVARVLWPGCQVDHVLVLEGSRRQSCSRSWLGARSRRRSGSHSSRAGSTCDARCRAPAGALASPR